jgi:acetylglutamate/LysW-gamma-L-alpha-aminoadipate kinase
VERVNAPLLHLLLEQGYLPVLSPPALSPDGPINVDGDRAAALVAATLGAGTLVLLTNVPGLLREVSDPTSLVETVTSETMEEALALAGGRMRVKVLAAREALTAGLERVVIGDGRGERPIARALEGRGTVVRR